MLSCSIMSNSLWPHGLQPTRLLCPWGFSRQEYESGLPCSPSARGSSQAHGSNPGLPLCRQIPYRLNHQGSPRILEWVAYPFSRGSSWSKDQTRVSCIADGFFTSWATGSHGKDLVIDIYLFLSRFPPYWLLQNIEYSSLCYTVGPCWLSILYIVLCIC